MSPSTLSPLYFRYIYLVIGTAWLGFAALLCWAGTFSDDYLIYVRGTIDSQLYPIKMIVIELALSALVSYLFAWSITAHSWKRVKRSLFVLAVSLSLSVLAIIGSMHAQTHFIYFARAILLVAFLSFLSTFFWIALGIRYKEP